MVEMNIYELPTPIVLADINRIRRNLGEVYDKAKMYGKKIWPMVKTHKSTYMAKIQREHGSDGFTVGTIDEAEVLVEKRITETIMCGNVYVADRENLMRLISLSELGTRVILRLDNYDAAVFINQELRKHSIKFDYVVKVDVGLHRFGVKPENIVKFVKSLQNLRNLNFVGIATHPGHVYSCTNQKCVKEVAENTSRIMLYVVSELKKYGFELEIIGTGATPTLRYDIENPIYTHLFPGNFIYYDRIQAELFGSTKLENCALTILTTIISIPKYSNKKLAIINVGSKHLGLDRGGHGVEALKGFGKIIEYPKALVISLSEEVAKLDISEEPSVRVGDKIRIIPNHACILSNSTSYIVLHEEKKIVDLIEVDMRNGTRIPKILREALPRLKGV
ncbi:MAG: alanine racemase [Ignisphaera sp.]